MIVRAPYVAAMIPGGASVATDVIVPPGRWALSPLSTVPLVGLQYGGFEEELALGESIEVKKPSVLTSRSFHAGEIVLTSSSPVIPATINVPASFEQVFDPVAIVNYYQSRLIDVRQARAAYCSFNTITSPALSWTTRHRSYRTNGLGPLTWAAGNPGVDAGSGGTVEYSWSASTWFNNIPLGIGLGETLDTLPPGRTLPELRPMALLDTVQIRVLRGTADAAGWIKGASGTLYADAFVTLVYR